MRIVLCGSLGSTAAMWDAQAPVLSGSEVVRVDHPGHGGAPLIEIGDIGDLGHSLLGAVGPGRFSFVGLSLGGAIGMWIAIHAPERLDRLVLCSTSAHFGESYRDRARTVRTEGIAPVVDGVLERWFTPAFPDVERYREMILSTEPEGYARCCEAIAAWDVRGRLGGVTAQTLVIAGADDPATPPHALAAIAGEIPGARLETIPNARHLLNVEFADEFNALLKEHL